nr:pyridoxamine 5'-phosphate oxidase [Microvirga terrestris]
MGPPEPKVTERDKTVSGLITGDFTESDEPFALFEAWMKEAEASEPNDPNAMALATVDETGLPNVRMVLLKGFDENGFVFYTNTESNKGRELLGQGKAALVLHWKSLRRQVRARGPVTLVSDQEADAYFQSRPRDSRIGAWASQQSRPLESRFALEKAVALNTAKFAVGEIPRPPHWTGFRIAPVSIEFWQDKPFRLHDRVVFSRDGDGWRKVRLYP